MNDPAGAPTDEGHPARRAKAGTVTRDLLLRTSARLFRTHGYDATSTRALSESLGIQKASLYHHIRGKEDLLFEVCTVSLARIHDAVATAADAAPSIRLQSMIDAHLAAALEDRDMHATMLVELGKLSADRQAIIRHDRDRHVALFESAIAADQERGAIRSDIPARYLTLSLLNLLNWTIFWFDPAGERSAPEISAFLGTIYLDGARPR
jgi:TetR/AcrR family transcriptional regulator, cholesterol catabolism regulator